jgi:hypothetical protein
MVQEKQHDLIYDSTSSTHSFAGSAPRNTGGDGTAMDDMGTTIDHDG